MTWTVQQKNKWLVLNMTDLMIYHNFIKWTARLTKQSLDIMKNINRHHECDNVMRDITIYNGKNIELADRLLQIEKVTALTKNSRIQNQLVHHIKCWKEWVVTLAGKKLNKKLEEVYSAIATEVHDASNIHRKQWPDETLQNIFKSLWTWQKRPWEQTQSTLQIES